MQIHKLIYIYIYIYVLLVSLLVLYYMYMFRLYYIFYTFILLNHLINLDIIFSCLFKPKQTAAPIHFLSECFTAGFGRLWPGLLLRVSPSFQGEVPYFVYIVEKLIGEPGRFLPLVWIR